ncbi:formate hydrogenlyase subunit 3/multisubunit Na+/H+ antiporter, MnhD subunit [Sulfuriferula multivorans]|uniref:Formate hydrogenlyase subunit 3/multisubunit Na+/H+ antiporter, MnhD subunit n=1 Tax=Sulfuriferula multivorans TaxID=1559896 RepID=A0A401JB61_9PROT|nr:hydrogenase 4 subunit F [Sulfuriferula multivorans]GBL44915.1 formate hydrogenlyase subunit 3/multisubunit Na+/H+ antiporter, MnhD subunit [Sulfuriferula multivorans]
MEILWLLGVPLCGGILLALFGHKHWAHELNTLMSLATFIAAVVLTVRIVNGGPMTAFSEQFFIDSFNVFLVALTAFVGFTTALFSRAYMRIEQHHGKLSANMLRLYHSMYQLFTFTMLLALTTNNMGILWVAMEAATLTTVLLVSLYRTPASLEAAWKYFILCGVGIAQALFGTILLYFAAEKLLGAGGNALLWTHLNEVKGHLEPTVLSLAFVFLLVGYGTKVGLAPLHNWLPDAHAEGPTPVSAVLSGLLLNVALYAVVRSKVLVDGALGSHLAGNLMMGFGLFSVVVAAFFLSRQKDVKRMFAYSSIEHMGLMTFAFGMGGAVATFAALLHMTVHSLTKSAIFFTVGHAAQKMGSQLIENIRGLIDTNPTIGWGLMLGSLAILGMPPFGVFASEFLIITTAMHEHPWATPFLLVALGVAFAAIFTRVQEMVFGETTGQRLPHPPALIPVFVHLALVLLLGLYIPPYLADWYRQAARLIG